MTGLSAPRGKRADEAPDAEFGLTLRPDSLAVRAALARLTAALGLRLCEEDIATLELVLAEAMNNVAEHACAGLTGRTLSVHVAVTSDAAVCTIADDGRAMKDRRLPETGTGIVPAPAEGGYGWFLIRTLASAIRYRRSPGRNTLTFRVPLAQATGADAAKMPDWLQN